MNYVGIDYHKKYSVVTAVDENGHVIRTTRLDNRSEPFQTFFSSLDGPSEAVLEATRTWGVLYDLPGQPRAAKGTLFLYLLYFLFLPPLSPLVQSPEQYTTC